MVIANIILAVIGVTILAALIYMILVMPDKLDDNLRNLLADYRNWTMRDERHLKRLNFVAKRMHDLVAGDEQSLDYLRLERARLKVEHDQIQDLNSFINAPESEAERRKFQQIEDVENRIDEHPDRERELEETRTRLVARMEEPRKDEEQA